MWRHSSYVQHIFAACLIVACGQTWGGQNNSDDPLSSSLQSGVQAPLTSLPATAHTCEILRTTQKKLTLTEIIHLVLCQHPQAQEAYANAQYQVAQFGLARTNLLPTLSATASANQNWAEKNPSGTSYTQQAANLSLSYLLYDFGARDAAIESAKQLIYAASASQNNIIQQLFFLAVQSYYQIQALHASLEAAKQSEQAALTSLKAAESRYQVGTAIPADRLQAKTAYSQAILNRIQIEGNLRNAEGVLANLIGQDANQPIALTFVSLNALPPSYFNDKSKMTRRLEKEITQLIAEARQKRPDLVASEAQIRAAKANLDSARATNKPTIMLNAGMGLQHLEGNSSFNTTSMIGINVNIPIFDAYNRLYRVKAAAAQIETKKAQYQRLYNQVSLDVWKAYQDLITATQSIETTTELVTSALRSEEVNLGRYKAGLGTILDVLNAQSALANAKQQRIQAIATWNITRATLAQAIGQLDYQLVLDLNQPDQSSGEKTP